MIRIVRIFINTGFPDFNNGIFFDVLKNRNIFCFSGRPDGKKRLISVNPANYSWDS